MAHRRSVDPRQRPGAAVEPAAIDAGLGAGGDLRTAHRDLQPDGHVPGVIGHLDQLVDLGVTHVELMPIAAFDGQVGWGYDGVALFAPHPAYGTAPELCRSWSASATLRGLAVCSTWCYNHLGPSGNHLAACGPYFTDRYSTPWGDAVNLDGPCSDGVRRFLVDNVLCWLERGRRRRRCAWMPCTRCSTSRRSRTWSNWPRRSDAWGCGPGGSPPVDRRVGPQRPPAVRAAAHAAPASMRCGPTTCTMRCTWHSRGSGPATTRTTTASDVPTVLVGGPCTTTAGGRRTVVAASGARSTRRGQPASAVVVSLQNHDQVGNRAQGDRVAPGRRS